MSKALGAILGAALIGGFLLARSKTAEASEPDTEEPLPPAMPPSDSPDSPAPLPDPLPAGGNSEFPVSERRDLLPPEIRDIDLSGSERYEAVGQGREGGGGPDGKAFWKWYVHDGLNGMTMFLYVGVDHPEDWIAFFDHPDGVGSVPPSHAVLYKISESPNKDWMLRVLAGFK